MEMGGKARALLKEERHWEKEPGDEKEKLQNLTHSFLQSSRSKLTPTIELVPARQLCKQLLSFSTWESVPHSR
jgi:hypothetical protein